MIKVLVIEDHPDMRELLVIQMERMGFLVIAARNGQEGLQKALEEKPRLILMDIMMPGIDGREVARILRSKAETRDIPILAATVLFQEPDIKSCLEAGCSAHLVKPFTFKELQGKIQEIISAA
jgi:CheY-like chemotaxis protein